MKKTIEQQEAYWKKWGPMGQSKCKKIIAAVNGEAMAAKAKGPDTLETKNRLLKKPKKPRFKPPWHVKAEDEAIKAIEAATKQSQLALKFP